MIVQRPLAAKLSRTPAKKKIATTPEKLAPTKSKATKPRPAKNQVSPQTPRRAAKPINVTSHLIEKARRLQQQLHELYPSPAIPLDSTSHFQLLIAVMLSAQVPSFIGNPPPHGTLC